MTRRSLCPARIEFHLMQGEDDFPRISFRRIRQSFGSLLHQVLPNARKAHSLLHQVSSDATAGRHTSRQVSFDATEGIRRLHQVLPDATEGLYPWHQVSSA